METDRDLPAAHRLTQCARQYLAALRERSLDAMVDFLHPAALERSGGIGEFRKQMAQMFAEADRNPDKGAMLKVELGTCRKIHAMDGFSFGVLPTFTPFVIEGKALGKLHTSMIALSYDDDSERWRFIEGTDEGLALLASEERNSISPLLPKPAFQPIQGRKRTYKDQASLKRHIFLIALAIMKPEAVADPAMREFAQALWRISEEIVRESLEDAQNP